MGRTRRKSSSQKIVDVVTMAMPSPVKHVASSRLGSMLLILLMPLLLVTGIVSVRWQDGWLRWTWDKQRAVQVKDSVTAEIKTRRSTEGNQQGSQLLEGVEAVAKHLSQRVTSPGASLAPGQPVTEEPRPFSAAPGLSPRFNSGPQLDTAAEPATGRNLGFR